MDPGGPTHLHGAAGTRPGGFLAADGNKRLKQGPTPAPSGTPQGQRELSWEGGGEEGAKGHQGRSPGSSTHGVGGMDTDPQHPPKGRGHHEGDRDRPWGQEGSP